MLATASGARGDFPSLYVAYNTADCTFKLTNDAGGGVTTIAPGAYQIVITTSDPYGVFGQSGGGLYACEGFVQFRLTGPGVSLFTTLDYGDAASELYPETFRAGGTYVLQDDNNVVGTRRSIAVSTTGPAPSPVTTSGGATGTGTSAAPRGVIDVGVSTAGKVKVSRKGRPIGALAAGRYTFSVHDQSKRGAFGLAPPKGKRRMLTSPAFVGYRDVAVELAPGRWTLFGAGGTAGTLLVVGSS